MKHKRLYVKHPTPVTQQKLSETRTRDPVAAGPQQGSLTAVGGQRSKVKAAQTRMLARIHVRFDLWRSADVSDVLLMTSSSVVTLTSPERLSASFQTNDDLCLLGGDEAPQGHFLF